MAEDSPYLEQLRAASDGGLIELGEDESPYDALVGREPATAVVEIVRLSQEAAAAVEADQPAAYRQAMKRIVLTAADQL
jgi:hypothetical protein